MNKSKIEKRKNNEKRFRQMVNENIELRKYYIERKKFKNEQGEWKEVKNILYGWRYKHQNYIDGQAEEMD